MANDAKRSGSPELLEGRLVAQRRVLGALLARLSRSDPAFLEELEGMAQYQDYEEDPGVLPDEAFAAQSAQSDEVRLILEAARRALER